MSAAQPEAQAAETPAPQPSNGQLTSPALTTQRQKNPKRVAAGKAVAEKRRLAREAQKKCRAEAAIIIANNKSNKADEKAAEPTSAQDATSRFIATVLAAGGLIVSATGVYYQREAIQARFKSLNPGNKESAPSPPVPSEPAIEIPKRKKGIRRME